MGNLVKYICKSVRATANFRDMTGFEVAPMSAMLAFHAFHLRGGKAHMIEVIMLKCPSLWHRSPFLSLNGCVGQATSP